MIGALDPSATGQAPDSVSAAAHAQVAARRMFLVALLTGVLAVLALGFAWNVTTRFTRESRVTYVKLAPNGTWDIASNMGESVEYFEATVRTVLYDWLTRRYSKRRATIIDDWGVANVMYNAANQSWFINEFRASEVAAEHARCGSCDDTVIQVRTHQHLTELPRSSGERDSAPMTTLFYATERTVGAGALTARSSREKIFKVQWRFLSKAAIQSRPDVLRWNPIGVQILSVDVTDDPK